jgi:pyruvate dehydrogenase E2 component (dihydrolipoamide acetyltransferase)
MSEITMPRLSDSMEEGTILKWLRGDGDEISAGDELLEVETDKATVTVESELAGVLRIAVAEGATVAVGTVIGSVGVPGDAGAGGQADSGGGVAASDGGNGTAPALALAATTPPVPALSTTPGYGREIPATPLARRAALEHGVALQGLTGTGPRGRISRGDVLAAAGIVEAPRAIPTASARSAPATPLPAPVRPAGPGETRELTRVQRVIAQRMSQSRSSIPEFEVQTEVRMDEALELREQLRGLPGEQPLPSVNDLIVRAVALALRRHPKLNASYAEDRLVVHEQVNIGIAVATEEALIVPTVRDADARSLGSLAAEARRLAEKVRDGSVTPEELSGATFTVSNLGMFGMTAIRPIINAPQVAILGVGAARETLALLEGRPTERRLMTLTLSCDHRAVYGADAARFLSEVRGLLETPLRLLL